MNILLVTNLRCGKGLAMDAGVLLFDLRELGHNPTAIDYRDALPPSSGVFDLAIFLETLSGEQAPEHIKRAVRRWWIPNGEWTEHQTQALIPAIDLILSKTRHGHDALVARYPDRPVEFLGFRAHDLRYESAPNRRFFHSAAGSTNKGTAAIREAWARFELPYPITLLGAKVPEEDYRAAQRRSLFHLFPSEYEGFGHAVHEGFSLGAVVATLPQWDDMRGAAAYFDSHTGPRRGCVDTQIVPPEAIAEMAEHLWRMTETEVAKRRTLARISFDLEAAAFRERLNLALG